MFCIHKFSDIQSDGYQYCKKCNKAILAQCNHNWVQAYKRDISKPSRMYPHNDILIGAQFILKCSKCGEMIKRDFLYLVESLIYV